MGTTPGTTVVLLRARLLNKSRRGAILVDFAPTTMSNQIPESALREVTEPNLFSTKSVVPPLSPKFRGNDN